MQPLLKKGASGEAVRKLQALLNNAGFPLDVDGDFGKRTEAAVKAFQSGHVDKHGRPLRVDGIVGGMTWWSLENLAKKPNPPDILDFSKLPSSSLGGSAWGRAALKTAIGEMLAGAGEIGGNNQGKWVRKYLNGLAPEGSSWCAAFTSWCYSRNLKGMPFTYSLGARDILAQFKKRGWTFDLKNGALPEPGDIVVWYRGEPTGWMGHVGLVHHAADGILYTIEGNRSSKVAGFDYPLASMQKLLGFGHVPDSWKP